MERAVDENPIDEVLDCSITFKDLGYQDGFYSNINGVEDVLVILLKQGFIISDVIENVFNYLCGYQIGEEVAKINTNQAEEAYKNEVSDTIFKVQSVQKTQAGILASKLAETFENPKNLYNIARRDMVVLKQNNAYIIAKILINSHYDISTICHMINKYLKGIDFEMNKKIIDGGDKDVIEPLPPLALYGVANHILERVCE